MWQSSSLQITKIENISEVDRYKNNYIKHEVPGHYSWQDCYAIALVVLLLPFSIIIFFISLFFIPNLINFVSFYRILRLHFPLSIVDRDYYFHAYIIIAFIFTIPLVLVAAIWVAFVYSTNFIFTIPFVCFEDGMEKSTKALKPYCNRPGAYDCETNNENPTASLLSRKHGYFWSFGDLFIAILGTMHREEYWEFLPSVPCMIAIIPVIKYVIMSNPRLYHNIEEVFTNQWTEPLDANGDFIVNGEDFRLAQQNLLEVFCHPLVTKKNKKVLDRWPFLGFHQLPPPKRESKTVAGMQFMEYRSKYFIHPRFTLLSHTTVPLNHWNLMNIPGYRPKSPTGAWTLLQVRLLSWNPFYIITGYVEVNIRKDIGVEHPMWICADRSSKLQMQLLNNINLLFVEIMYRFLLYLREQKEFQGSQRYTFTPWKPNYYDDEHEILHFRWKIRRKFAL